MRSLALSPLVLAVTGPGPVLLLRLRAYEGAAISISLLRPRAVHPAPKRGRLARRRDRSRSLGAGVAAQAAVRPPRVRISHGVEHVAAGAASRPAGAADWAGPGAADEEVRLALRDGHGMPEAGVLAVTKPGPVLLLRSLAYQSAAFPTLATIMIPSVAREAEPTRSSAPEQGGASRADMSWKESG